MEEKNRQIAQKSQEIMGLIDALVPLSVDLRQSLLNKDLMQVEHFSQCVTYNASDIRRLVDDIRWIECDDTLADAMGYGGDD